MPHSFLWNNNIEDNHINVQPTEATTYSVTVTDVNGCTATDEVVVNPAYPLPPVPEPSNTGPYCAGETIELYTPQHEGLTYRWHSFPFEVNNDGSPADHFNTYYSEDNYEVTIENARNHFCCADDVYDTYHMNGPYTAYVQNEYGCINSASTEVEIYPEDLSCLSIEVYNISNNSTDKFCAGDDITIDINGNYLSNCAFEEAEITVSGPTINNEPYIGAPVSDFVIENIGPEHSGIYTITISTMCFEITLEDEIVVHDPDVTLQNVYGFCEGDEILIEPVISNNIDLFNWEGPDSFESTNPLLEFENVTPNIEGEYELMVTDVFGCTASATTNITVFDYSYQGNLTIDSNSPVCYGEDITLTAESNYNGIIEYNWTDPNGNFLSNDASIIISNATYNDIGNYTVEIQFDPIENNPCDERIQSTLVMVTDCEETINISCSQIPVTCQDPYNGKIEISMNNGTPPYSASLYRNGNLLSFTENLEANENHTIELQGVEPNSSPITIVVEDNAGNSSFHTLTEGLNYAWDHVITQNNLYFNNQYEDQILCVGDNENQGLDFYQNFTFDNCTIYTSTHEVTGLENTTWTLNMPNTLEIYNTTIKSGCPDKMWQGIYSDGIAGELQSPEDTKIIIDNSAICDAIKAVDIFGGGTLTVTNSEFINNVQDLLFYDSQNNTITINNNGFKTNSQLNYQVFYPKAHVDLYKTSNIIFNGNEFINSTPYSTDPEFPVHKRGTGIKSLASSFIVTPVNQLTWTPIGTNSENRFEGLFYGIKSEYHCTTPPAIYFNEFENNFRGIYLGNSHGSRVLFNDISTTQENTYFDETFAENINGLEEVASSYGMYVNSCRQFSIEENSFKNGNVGIYMYNSGEAAGQKIYRNTFGDEPQSGNNFNMNSAVVVLGKNSRFVYDNPEFPGLIGLQTRCNNYTATENAISVINGNMRKNQGVYMGATDELAGNQFHETFTNGMEFTSQFTSEFEMYNLGTYKYFRHDEFGSDDNGFYRELINYSGVTEYPSWGTPFIEENSCLTNYNETPIIEPGEFIVFIGELQNNLTSKESEYVQIVDKGNTTHLKSVAESMNSQNFFTVYLTLCNNGYLSNTVFDAILNNQSIPQVVTTALLLANSPLPEVTQQKVQKSHLTNWQKMLIAYYQQGINNREKLEFAMADIKQEIATIESDMLINFANNDSTPAYRENVMNYFSQKADENIENYINRFNLHLFEGDYNNALILLNTLQNYASRFSNDSIFQEIQHYCDVNNILISVLKDNQYKETKLENNLAFLRQSAKVYSPWYSNISKSLYALATDSILLEYTPIPHPEVSTKLAVCKPDLNSIFSPEIKLYPNPVKELLFVEYNFISMSETGTDLLLKELDYEKTNTCKNGNIVVYSNSGQKLVDLELSQSLGIIRINFKDFAAGNYIVEVTDCYGFTNSTKIVKQ